MTDLHIMLFWMRHWRRWWNIFPGHPDITLMMLLPCMTCVAKLDTCIVTPLKSTVQLFIPVGALLTVIQLPVMVCNCMARQSRISLNRNRHVSGMMSWNLHGHWHWSCRLIAIWVLGVMVVLQTIDILPRMIIWRERRKKQWRWLKQEEWRMGRVKQGRIHRWKKTLWSRCSKETTSLKEVRLWDISLRGSSLPGTAC